MTNFPTLGALIVLVIGVAVPGRDNAASANLRQELHCLALNIYFEARSEPKLGKIAVSHVVMNRVASKMFPDTICSVVKQGGETRRHRCQFSWWCDGRSDIPKDKTAWRDSRALAQKIYWGLTRDPTRGALWYHAKYVMPSWRKRLARSAVIGEHIFYLPVQKVAAVAEPVPPATGQ